MKDKERILNQKMRKYGIKKGWVPESKQAVLESMDAYANEILRSLSTKMEDALKGDYITNIDENAGYRRAMEEAIDMIYHELIPFSSEEYEYEWTFTYYDKNSATAVTVYGQEAIEAMDQFFNDCDKNQTQ